MIRALRAVVLACVVVVAGCCQNAPTLAAEYAKSLSGRITTDAVMAHLQKLQDIADAHDDTRAAGTPGFEASVDYVVDRLKDKGFDVQTPEFSARTYWVDAESLTVNGVPVDAHVMDYSGVTSPTGLDAPLVAVPSDNSRGCQVSDYDGLLITAAIVLVDRGKCDFDSKIFAATSRGAVGFVMVDDRDEKQLLYGLSEKDDVKIPVMWVSKADGAKLRTQTGPAHLVVDAEARDVKTRNVIAQTGTGSPENVVVVGAHLDSVRFGPGINDNGSGVAAVLETALQLGSRPSTHNAVRFAFWGAEEEGLLGSRDYVRSLEEEQLQNIALYLNFDMIGSPNPAYLSIDGNISTLPDQERYGQQIIPEGSAGIDRAFVEYLRSVGKTAQDYPFDGRSDFDSFARAGIPVGGLCTGEEQFKTPEQAKLWGGQAGVAFDPNYHSRDDTVANVDLGAIGIMAPAVGYLVGRYAQDQRGRNGVPIRDDRTRHVPEAA